MDSTHSRVCNVRLVQATMEELSRINNKNMANSIAWTTANLRVTTQSGIPSFSLPATVKLANSAIEVTISAEGRTSSTEFSLLQQQEEGSGWIGGMPEDMNVVVNRKIAPVRLTFNTPIYAFSAYIQVSER